MEFYMSKRLRDLRENNVFTQKQIAEYLYVKQSAYSRYERNSRNIPIEYLFKLADYYNVSVDYILGRTNNPDVNK